MYRPVAIRRRHRHVSRMHAVHSFDQRCSHFRICRRDFGRRRPQCPVDMLGIPAREQNMLEVGCPELREYWAVVASSPFASAMPWSVGYANSLWMAMLAPLPRRRELQPSALMFAQVSISIRSMLFTGLSLTGSGQRIAAVAIEYPPSTQSDPRWQNEYDAPGSALSRRPSGRSRDATTIHSRDLQAHRRTQPGSADRRRSGTRIRCVGSPHGTSRSSQSR